MQKNNSSIIIQASGEAAFNGKEYNCAIGRNGLTGGKKEGRFIGDLKRLR